MRTPIKDDNTDRATKLTVSISRLGHQMQDVLGIDNPTLIEIEQYLTDASKFVLFACEAYKRARR